MRKSVPIPADIDQEDRLVGFLTARQLVIVAIPAIALWGFYLATRGFLPLFVFAPIVVFTSGVVIALVIGRRDGLGMDRFVLAALRHQRQPHLMVPAPHGVSEPPAFVAPHARSVPTPLNLPVVEVDASGVVDLGLDGAAVIAVASSVNFALQTENDQELLAASFGRFCNSLQESIQFAIRSRPVDVTAAIEELQSSARALPSLELERAALSHAAFLRDLTTKKDTLTRSVLVIFRDSRPADLSSSRLIRRAQDAVTGLRAAGVELRMLTGLEAMQEVQASCDPTGSRSPFDDSAIVTGGTR